MLFITQVVWLMIINIIFFIHTYELMIYHTAISPNRQAGYTFVRAHCNHIHSLIIWYDNKLVEIYDTRGYNLYYKLIYKLWLVKCPDHNFILTQ